MVRWSYSLSIKDLKSFTQFRCPVTKRRYTVLTAIVLWAIYFIIPEFNYQKNMEIQLLKNFKYETGCNFPKIDPFFEEILKFETAATPIVCSGQDWVRCNMSECGVISSVLNKIKDITCSYKDILYINDYEYSLSGERTVIGSNYYILNKSDHVVVECKGNENGTLKTWSGVALGFRKVKPKAFNSKIKKSPNILFLMFDSLSKGGFVRRMPKSYKLLTEKLKAVIMNGHNVVGDGTGVQVLAMLTGKLDLEEPDIFRSMIKFHKKYMDDLPFVFYKLHEYGYRTALFEDSPHVGTFSYRYNGFMKQPADHYLFPFSTVVSENRYNRFVKPPLALKFKNDIERKYCVGDTPEYALMLNTTRQFFNLNSKKFCFNFIVNSSHDIFSMISNVDDKLVEFLTEFQRDGHLENTVLFVMGDHGPRFGKIRSTLYGKLEERLPLLAIILPSNLKRRRPDAEKNLKLNSEVLTTHYDIHATILDAVGLDEFTNSYSVPGIGIPRSLSMLQKIPKTRSCSEAGIELQWCSCIKWFKVPSYERIYVKSAKAIVEHINNVTLNYRSKCAVRKLAQIDWVLRQQPHEKLINAIGGRALKVKSEYIQVRVIVDPAKSEFEATLRYNEDMKITIESSDISRTDRYGNQPHCITDVEPNLSKFCYCNDLLGKQ